MTDAERARRIIEALLSTIDTWMEQVNEIADAAIPVTGNKARALHLLKAMQQCKISLRKLAGLAEEEA